MSDFLSPGMFLGKQFFWDLSEFADGDLGTFDLIFIFKFENIVLVCSVIVKVVINFCSLSPRFTTKNEVDPLAKLF